MYFTYKFSGKTAAVSTFSNNFRDMFFEKLFEKVKK